MSNRVTRGAWIAVNRRIVKIKGRDAWLVPADSGGGFHVVTENGCDCKDDEYRGPGCKHLVAVMAMDAIPRLQEEAKA